MGWGTIICECECVCVCVCVSVCETVCVRVCVCEPYSIPTRLDALMLAQVRPRLPPHSLSGMCDV